MAMMTGKYNNMSDEELLNSLDAELLKRLTKMVRKSYVPRTQHEALMTQFKKLTSTNSSLIVKLKQQIARGNCYREAAIVSETKGGDRRAAMERAKKAAVSSGHFVKVS